MPSAPLSRPLAPSRSAAATLSPTRRNLVLAVMCLAVLMVVASVTMLANALPAVSADLGASQAQQQWIVDAYALTLAALLLPAGALGDRYGRRGALITGFALFGIAATLAVGADSATQLIALRAAMGIGAALVMPGTLSTITSIFPPRSARRPLASGRASRGLVAPSDYSPRARCSRRSRGSRCSRQRPRSRSRSSSP